MRLLFLVVVALGVWFYLARRRRFDFLAVGFLSCCAYFLPAFLGFAADRHFDGPVSLTGRPIVFEAYLVMLCPLVLLILAGIVYDARHEDDFFVEDRRSPALAWAPWIATLIGVLGFAMTVRELGSFLLHYDKSEILAKMGRSYALWQTGAVVGTVLALMTRSWWALAVCSFLVAADLYVGFRSTAAMAVIGVFTCLLSRGVAKAIFTPRNLPWITAAAFAGISFFIYKRLLLAIKLGAWGLVGERLTDPEYLFEMAILGSEPFHTVGTLNEVVRANFRVGWEHYASVINVMVPFAPNLGGEVVSFNARFQPALFPNLEAGLASNFLAEAWSAGGRFGVFFASLLYVGGLWVGSRLLSARGAMARAFALVFFPYWAFYIHRNDLLFQLILQRRVVLVFLLAVGLSILVSEALRRPRVGTEETPGEMPARS